MDLEKQILAEHSKRNMQLVIDYIGNDPKRFKELLHLFAKGDYRLTQRAAWPLSYVALAHPNLAKKHVHFLCNLLDQSLHISVKRNVLRLFSVVDIPESELGPMADKCFKYLHDIKEPGAVKAFAMTVLYKICLKEPELKNELIPTLEAMIPGGTPAIVSRGKKVLKLLGKI